MASWWLPANAGREFSVRLDVAFGVNRGASAGEGADLLSAHVRFSTNSLFRKPSNDGVWCIPKSVFRIHCFTEQVCWDLTATHAGIEHALDWLKALARGSGCRS